MDGDPEAGAAGDGAVVADRGLGGIGDVVHGRGAGAVHADAARAARQRPRDAQRQHGDLRRLGGLQIDRAARAHRRAVDGGGHRVADGVDGRGSADRAADAFARADRPGQGDAARVGDDRRFVRGGQPHYLAGPAADGAAARHQRRRRVVDGVARAGAGAGEGGVPPLPRGDGD